MRNLWLTLVLTLSACTPQLRRLAYDQGVVARRLTTISGSVSATDGGEGAILAAALTRHPDGSLEIENYQSVPASGRFELQVFLGEYVVAAFRDINGNLRHDEGEPGAFWNAGSAVDVRDRRTRTDIRLTVASPLAIQNVRTPMRQYLRVGEIVSLTDERFDRRATQLAQWQPARFVQRYGAGIFFLAPHRRDRVPVVFVHGMGGSPREFATLIGALDHDRYEPWVVQYPSGWDLEEVSAYLYRLLNEATLIHGVEELHIVAHSMGGVVTRAALNHYGQDTARRRDYVRGFVTLASPLGGHPSAHQGVQWSPVVLPSWRALDPQSEFIANLYRSPLPASIRYDLIYADGRGESDGVVPVASQLRVEALREARTRQGFPVGHTDVLRLSDVVRYTLARLGSVQGVAPEASLAPLAQADPISIRD
jgi:pimeloyl-ACP methyl ester carboxylesterase